MDMMKGEGSKKSKFLEELIFLDQLKDIDVSLILYHMENFASASRSLRSDSLEEIKLSRKTFKQRVRLRDKIRRPDAHLEGGPIIFLQGIDLGDIKHYTYPELSKYTNDSEGKYEFGKTEYGRFLQGWIHKGCVAKQVLIKTWNLVEPIAPSTELQPLRLHNEIMLLTNDLEPHENLPKLIGYSIDKKLAVVYDLKPTTTLYNALGLEYDLDWKSRFSAAIQVARLLQHFHSKDITFGSIDSKNIIIDEEGYVKLCEFGLTARRQKMDKDIRRTLHFSERYIYCDSCEREVEWTVKSDMIAFGHLLLELITKLRLNPVCKLTWTSDTWCSGDLPENLVDESFSVDAKTGSIITDLALKCLHEDPVQRPNAEYVVELLADLARVQFESEIPNSGTSDQVGRRGKIKIPISVTRATPSPYKPRPPPPSSLH